IYAGRVRAIKTAGGHNRIPEAEVERLSTPPPPKPQPKQTRLRGRTAIVLGDANRLRGRVEELRSDGSVARIGLQVGDQRLTAVVPANALTALRLRRGDDAVAIIKSSDVIIAKHQPTGKSRRHRRHKDEASS